MSKGSTRRPTFISDAEETAAWERTFGKKTPDGELTVLGAPVVGGPAWCAALARGEFPAPPRCTHEGADVCKLCSSDY